ncbi:glycine zipper 2TM domain-containing protein [Sphingobium algorifonticola]|uniref:17 kDa surface antigen n=1 Tax=Sphingobium algorifonticola TaxID=2008318 RepID=A0A437J8N0_9SPHN|nr:glycine zipper 2TM domain-containing protein [Sphingobium algorifonticola]RVT41861.1 glycine zipper 2TM domain-containing protein [Sphingobium algorifonticola]
MKRFLLAITMAATSLTAVPAMAQGQGWQNRNARIYRGGDGRYYCRRQDGTTGLIIGAAVGGLLGNRIDNGNSSLLGTLLGAGGGALLGREIDRGNVRCR